MDRRMQRAACRDLEKIVHESKNFFFPLVKCFPSEKSKSVKGSTRKTEPPKIGVSFHLTFWVSTVSLLVCWCVV